MKKRVLLIDDNHHPRNSGAPLFSMEREFLIEAGYEVYTLSFDSVKINNRFDFVINLGESRVKNKIIKFFGSEKLENNIRNVIETISPDLIHCHLISKYPISVFRGIPSDIPLVQTLHGPNFFCPTSWGNIKQNSEYCDLGCSSKCVKKKCIPLYHYPLMINLFNKLPSLLSKVDVFHCPSNHIANVAKNFGFYNIEVIALGLREQFSGVVRKNKFIGENILFIGSLHEVKGLDYLLESLNKIREAIPNVKLHIAGRGASLNKYKKMVIELGLDAHVDFLGYVSSTEIVKLYQSMDITVVPSIWSEQFGMVGPESLACGVPVIASDVGGIPEWLIDGKCGVLVPPRDIEALSSQIIKLLKSPPLLEHYSKYGYEFIRSVHTNEKYKINLLKLIENAIS